MLTINKLEVHYKEFRALNITRPIQVSKGDRIGIIGSNGSGKTTLIKACLKMIPYSGSIQTDIDPNDMAVHMQSNDYVETMNTRYILEAILNTNIKDNEKLQELIDFFDFNPNLDKKYKNLSGGQKQRFTLIMILMQDAPLTFFDEVTTGLDFETRQALIQKILEWYDGKNASIMFVTHYYEELAQLTNKLLILDKGKLIDFGTHDELFAKYCGHSIIRCDITPETEDDFASYKQLRSPNNSIVISCNNSDEEMEIIKKLNAKNLNFRRSNNDIEILTLNAIGGSN